MTVEVTDPRKAHRLRHATRIPSHRVLGAALGVVAAVAGFGLVFVETSLDRLDDNFTTQAIDQLLPQTTPDATPTAVNPVDASAGEPLDILLMGSDSRTGENADLSHDSFEGMRNDTTIVMHISADRSRVEMVSIPRDSRVAISDCKMLDGSTVPGWTGKFNIAFSNGGQNGNVAEAAACVATTVYDLTGILVDHYAVVDFSGFVGMVDALGGVPMCITEDVDDSAANLHLEAGAQVLDGEEALGWARVRKSLGDGTDLMRIERQQELLTNMARKALGLNILTDATKGTAFINALAKSLTMDPELGDSHYLLGLAWSLRNFDTSNLYMTTVPWHYAGDGSGDVLWTEPDATEMWEALRADESINPANAPQESPAPTLSATAEASATPSETASTEPTTGAEPTVTPSPERETQADILAECVID